MLHNKDLHNLSSSEHIIRRMRWVEHSAHLGNVYISLVTKSEGK
jgi:hypothetical protein